MSPAEGLERAICSARIEIRVVAAELGALAPLEAIAIKVGIDLVDAADVHASNNTSSDPMELACESSVPRVSPETNSGESFLAVRNKNASRTRGSES